METQEQIRTSGAARLLPVALHAGIMAGYRLGIATAKAKQISVTAQQEIRDIAAAFEPADPVYTVAQQSPDFASSISEPTSPIRAIGKDALRAGLQTATIVALAAVGERLIANRPGGAKPSRTASALGGIAAALSRGMPRP